MKLTSLGWILVALQFLFLTLRLCEVIAWSWWLVMTPLEWMLFWNTLGGILHLITYWNETPLERKIRLYREALFP